MIFRLHTKTKYTDVEDIKDVLDEMETHKDNISMLDLSMNTYMPVVAEKLAEKIRKMKNLKHVRMESIVDSLTKEEMGESITHLVSAFPDNLEDLEISSCALSCEYPDAISEFLGRCPLRSLKLYDCGLGEEGLIRLTKDLEKLENKENLKSLNLGRNRLNCMHKEFTGLFNSYPNIEEFRIRSNTIEEEGLAYFLENAHCSNLRVLDISDNFVSGDCHSALGKLFLRSRIQELHLYDGKMDDGGLKEFLEIVTSVPSEGLPGGLSDGRPDLILDISCLDAEQDCVPLLERLAELYNIKKLVLFENQFDDISKLADMVRETGGVVLDTEDITVDDNILSRDLMERIKNIL